jgi:undecaprenyl-diphosphatase
VSELLALDARLFVLINQEWTAGWLDAAMPVITDFTYWRIPVIVGLLVALARGSTETRIGVLFAILAVVAADQVASSGIKPIVDRARPFHVIEGTRQLIDAYASSFPSSHAANTFAAGTFLALRFRRWWPILVLPIVVSYSRVYVGVHYPLDVLAGVALGAGVGAGFAALERVLRIRLEDFFSRRKSPPDESPPDD